MEHGLSTRALSRARGGFVRSTPGSQSLTRGLQLLRAFRLGRGTLSNAELAERTSLPRPTVSRLTRSLVEAGFLDYDHQERGYRLAPVCLSLALAYRSSDTWLDVALPLMRSLAEGRRINVGLARADQLDMVYLDSVRLSRLGIFRRLVPGSRIPMALTALGRAHLAGLPVAARRTLLAQLRVAHAADWPDVQRDITAALRAVRLQGCCHVQWQPGMTSVAAPLRAPCGRLYAVNVSYPESDPMATGPVEVHAALLRQLLQEVRAAWAQFGPADEG